MAPKFKNSSLTHNYSLIRGSIGDKLSGLLAGGCHFRRTESNGFRFSMHVWYHPTLPSAFINAEHPAILKIYRGNDIGDVQFVDVRRYPRWKPSHFDVPSSVPMLLIT